MALLACPGFYGQGGGAAQEEIGKIAKPQQIGERADELRKVSR